MSAGHHQGSWTDVALKRIAAQIAESGLTDRIEQMAYCRSRYPFAVRQGWAYKAWLKAMQETFGTAKPKHRGLRGELLHDDKTGELFT